MPFHWRETYQSNRAGPGKFLLFPDGFADDNCLQSPPDNWGEGCYFFMINVGEVRQQHAGPTPYMDNMPDPTAFDQKVSFISSQIRSADDSIAQVQNLQTNSTTIPTNAELFLNESIGLFNNGSYAAADDAANQAYQLSAESTTASNAPGNAVGNFTVLGAAGAGIVVAVVIAIGVMRQKRGTRPQHTDESKTKRVLPRLQACSVHHVALPWGPKTSSVRNAEQRARSELTPLQT